MERSNKKSKNEMIHSLKKQKIVFNYNTVKPHTTLNLIKIWKGDLWP